MFSPTSTLKLNLTVRNNLRIQVLTFVYCSQLCIVHKKNVFAQLLTNGIKYCY